MKRKLIEVALPLDAINRESAREKSIRHGHPSTLHLWWARRPLAACRAVLFAQLVDDPSAHPDRFPSEEDQALERKRLFDLIERLVVWENASDERLLREAHDEIAKCFDGKPPAILDPFAGGGSIPLEAQRLGLEAHASDLNPVAVLINKALVEIPPRWAGQSPVFPGAADSRLSDWPRATGLAEDVRRYGAWMRDEAEKRIGRHYPKATLPDGTKVAVIAWLWARTITCPNPACGATMPLLSTFWLSKKKDRPTWLRPVVEQKTIRFEVQVGGAPPDPPKRGQGAKFVCLACGEPAPPHSVYEAFDGHRDSAQLLACVAIVGRRRIYLPASDEQVAAASVPRPRNAPDQPARGTFGGNAQGRRYGFDTFADYFTNRQLEALITLSDLVRDARDRISADASVGGMSGVDAERYADAVSTYLALIVSRLSDYQASTTTWANNPQMEILRNTFARQGIAMTWDFAEGNPFAESSGSLTIMVSAISRAIDMLPARTPGAASQADATVVKIDGEAISTDPPYYDNIVYSDLSDFFYVWLRRSLEGIYPELFRTVLTPKGEELVANVYRFAGSREKAEQHFESGFLRTFSHIRQSHSRAVPITIMYAFKQAESDETGVASTGWEKMLNGLMEAGLAVMATWPMRTERTGRSVGIGRNALASSIVLACRPRALTAEATTRRGLIQALKRDLPKALRELQQGSIAPVDLAQAAIGPGMAVFTRYRSVVEADGSPMTVRTALALINEVLDEVLVEQEGDFSADTRFCVKWFSQFAWNEQPYGRAEELSRATNTSVEGLVRGGVFWARAGKARLLGLDELSEDWDPATDERVSEWEVVVRLAKALDEQGVDEAALLMALAGQRVDLDTTKELAYLLFSVCEKRGWTDSALLFNSLGTSWLDLSSAARHTRPTEVQAELDLEA